MLIIGFGNKARQGKDSAAQAIKDYYTDRMVWNEEERGMRLCGTKIGIFKFATALYQEVNEHLAIAKSFDYSYEELFSMGVRECSGRDIVVTKIPDWVQPDPNPEISDLAPHGKHPKLLQWWGTDYRRAQDPDYWVSKLFVNIPANLDIALITDVRFSNEADAIKKRGGYNVNIQRLREDGQPFYASDRPADHPSELALDNYNWDFKLTNHAGHEALLGEQAVTLTEYLRGLIE
jgi:hypothetical protein